MDLKLHSEAQFIDYAGRGTSILAGIIQSK